MCSRKVVVKPLIFRLFRTLPVSQRLRFFCLIIMACETSGIKLQGPSLCIRTHGWKFLSKKVDRLLTKNPLSETNVEFGFFVSSFLGQLFCFRISPCWSQHRLGPCSFIPVGDSRHDALNRNFLRMRKRRRYIRTEILPSNQLHESGLLHNLHRLFIHMREYQRNSLIFTYFCQVK